ncbi:MAG: ABC transporter ATP-binding protein [Deltaproteobacteria bacterium]|nr:ABC transporter ATP-binding protein [Deltaproteobacteria bacterium]
MEINEKPARALEKSDLDVSSKIRPGAVRFTTVSKRFRKQTASRRGYTTIKSRLMSRFFGRPATRGRYVMALRNVSIDIKPGEALGVIGKNGSGKSTMLKLIAGIYRADRGSVQVGGKLSALIELGAGFHPDFTGRENIQLGGVMFGLSRAEIDRKFDDIVRFAELEDYIDDPVRTYSSGMYMRLGFSLAVHTDPDILLIDEVLAVGDASFIHRCQERISDFKRRGKTLIFVTHDLESVARWCDDVIWLDRGRVRDRGEPRRVVGRYLSEIETQEKKSLQTENESLSEASDANGGDAESATEVEAPIDENRWGNGAVELLKVSMFGDNGEEKWLFHDEEPITVRIDYAVKRPVEDLVFGFGILRSDGAVVVGSNTAIEKVEAPITSDRTKTEVEGERQFVDPALGSFTIRWKRTGLIEDSYYLDVAAHRGDGTPYDYHHLLHKFSIRSASRFHGVFHPEGSWAFTPSYSVAAPTSAGSASAPRRMSGS